MSTNDPLESFRLKPAGASAPTPNVPSEQDPLDAFRLNPPTAASTATLPSAQTVATSSDPLDAFRIGYKPNAEPNTPTTEYDPLDRFRVDSYGKDIGTHGLTNTERAYGHTDPEKMEDEPWYSRAWEWMNSPLWDLHQWGTRTGAGSFERGLETGLEDIGSSFTSPLMIGLTIASFGGGAVEGAGVAALRTIGVNEYAAPIVARTAKGLLTAGFTAQMLGGLMTQAPQFLDALKDGDVENATRLGTNILASGVFIREGMKHGLEDVKAVKSYISGKDLTTTDRLKLVQEAASIYDESIEMGKDAARARQEEILRQLKAGGGDDPIREAGIRHWITQDGDTERIAKMKGIAEGTLKSRDLTPEETKTQEAGTELRKWMTDSIYKEPTGEPLALYTTAATPETNQLGQTLSAAKSAGAEEHYVKIENPAPLSGEDNLQQQIRKAGQEAGVFANEGGGSPTSEEWVRAQNAYKEKLIKEGHDGITFKTKEGNYRVIALNPDEQLRPTSQYQEAANSAWNRQHVYIAVERKNLEQIRNSGIGVKTEKNNLKYHATPDLALENAEMPASGNKKDLAVLSVPRSEIETDSRETEAKNEGKTKRADIGPVKVRSTAFNPHEEMRTRLVNPELVDQAIVLRDSDTGHAHPEIAIPVGGDRVSGAITAGVSKTNADALMKQLEDKPGFPDLRLTKNNSGDLEIQWGQKMPWREAGSNLPTDEWARKSGQAFGYKPKLIGETSATVPDDQLIASKSHMPGHILERDETGNLTGRSTPLRPMGAEDLPGDNSRFMSKLTPAQRDDYLKGLDYAIHHMTEDDKAMARTLRQLYDNSFQKAYENGLIRSWIESYHPQAWAGENNSMWNKVFGKVPEKVTNPALNQLRYDTDAGHFSTNINQAKQRVYNTEFEGVMAGEVFKSPDLAMHAYDHMVAIDRAIAGNKFLEALRTKGAKASDGRPAVVLAGTARVMGAETNNPAVALDPKSAKTINISPEIVEKMREGINPKTGTNDLQDGLNKGYIYKLPWEVTNEEGVKSPAYAYSSDGYVKIDSQHTRGWGYGGVDTAGHPTVFHGDLLVHPDYEKFVRRVIGAEKSVVRESPALRTVNWAAGEAKGLLLSISPFHIVQEALRAMMVGIAPWDYAHIDINDPKYSESLRRGVRQGLKRDDYVAQDKYSSGMASHSSVINAIPGLNQFQGWMQDTLFNKIIPGYKDRAYLKIFDDMRDANPHLTDDEAAARAADMVNDTFGGQNWRKLGVSASTQDFARMFALAPDWLLSEVRMGARAFGFMDKESGAFARKVMIKQMAAIWLGARVLNMLSTGQMHNEAPFGVVSKNEKGEETVYSVRTLPTDLMHAISSPEEFIAGRVNPLTVRPTVEFLTGRDALGRRAPFDRQVGDLTRNIMPIATQGLTKNSPLSFGQQLAKGLGANPYRYRTEAEKLAERYSSDRMPSGPVDQEHLRAHQTDIALEDAFRKGQISKSDIMKQVSKRRADEIVRRAPLTPLQARFDRLPLSEAINVWNAASKSEKDELTNMPRKSSSLWQKRVNYMKQHNAAQRVDDPTWRKLQSVYADLR